MVEWLEGTRITAISLSSISAIGSLIVVVSYIRILLRFRTHQRTFLDTVDRQPKIDNPSTCLSCESSLATPCINGPFFSPCNLQNYNIQGYNQDTSSAENKQAHNCLHNNELYLYSKQFSHTQTIHQTIGLYNGENLCSVSLSSNKSEIHVNLGVDGERIEGVATKAGNRSPMVINRSVSNVTTMLAPPKSRGNEINNGAGNRSIHHQEQKTHGSANAGTSTAPANTVKDENVYKDGTVSQPTRKSKRQKIANALFPSRIMDFSRLENWPPSRIPSSKIALLSGVDFFMHITWILNSIAAKSASSCTALMFFHQWVQLFYLFFLAVFVLRSAIRLRTLQPNPPQTARYRDLVHLGSTLFISFAFSLLPAIFMAVSYDSTLKICWFSRNSKTAVRWTWTTLNIWVVFGLLFLISISIYVFVILTEEQRDILRYIGSRSPQKTTTQHQLMFSGAAASRPQTTNIITPMHPNFGGLEDLTKPRSARTNHTMHSRYSNQMSHRHCNNSLYNYPYSHTHRYNSQNLQTLHNNYHHNYHHNHNQQQQQQQQQQLSEYKSDINSSRRASSPSDRNTGNTTRIMRSHPAHPVAIAHEALHGRRPAPQQSQEHIKGTSHTHCNGSTRGYRHRSCIHVIQQSHNTASHRISNSTVPQHTKIQRHQSEMVIRNNEFSDWQTGLNNGTYNDRIQAYDVLSHSSTERLPMSNGCCMGEITNDSESSGLSIHPCESDRRLLVKPKHSPSTSSSVPGTIGSLTPHSTGSDSCNLIVRQQKARHMSSIQPKRTIMPKAEYSRIAKHMSMPVNNNLTDAPGYEMYRLRAVPVQTQVQMYQSPYQNHTVLPHYHLENNRHYCSCQDTCHQRYNSNYGQKVSPIHNHNHYHYHHHRRHRYCDSKHRYHHQSNNTYSGAHFTLNSSNINNAAIPPMPTASSPQHKRYTACPAVALRQSIQFTQPQAQPPLALGTTKEAVVNIGPPPKKRKRKRDGTILDGTPAIYSRERSKVAVLEETEGKLTNNSGNSRSRGTGKKRSTAGYSRSESLKWHLQNLLSRLGLLNTKRASNNSSRRIPGHLQRVETRIKVLISTGALRVGARALVPLLTQILVVVWSTMHTSGYINSDSVFPAASILLSLQGTFDMALYYLFDTRTDTSDSNLSMYFLTGRSLATSNSNIHPISPIYRSQDNFVGGSQRSAGNRHNSLGDNNNNDASTMPSVNKRYSSIEKPRGSNPPAAGRLKSAHMSMSPAGASRNGFTFNVDSSLNIRKLNRSSNAMQSDTLNGSDNLDWSQFDACASSMCGDTSASHMSDPYNVSGSQHRTSCNFNNTNTAHQKRLPVLNGWEEEDADDERSSRRATQLMFYNPETTRNSRHSISNFSSIANDSCDYQSRCSKIQCCSRASSAGTRKSSAQDSNCSVYHHQALVRSWRISIGSLSQTQGSAANDPPEASKKLASPTPSNL